LIDVFQVPDQKTDALSNAVSVNLLLVRQMILDVCECGEKKGLARAFVSLINILCNGTRDSDN
jgi:hypothetical protein